MPEDDSLVLVVIVAAHLKAEASAPRYANATDAITLNM